MQATNIYNPINAHNVFQIKGPIITTTCLKMARRVEKTAIGIDLGTTYSCYHMTHDKSASLDNLGLCSANWEPHICFKIYV
ncbi:putative Heat shock protein [Helianthus debilis subsp. tardiflorus]